MQLGKPNSLDRILDRIGDMDEANLSILVQRLARERRLLETILDTIREGVLIIDGEGIIEHGNEAASRMIGFDRKDQGQNPLWKLIPELARTLELSIDGEYSEISVVSREVQLTYPEDRYLRIYLIPFSDEDIDIHEGKRYAVVLSDITEEKITVREMIEDEKTSSILMLAAGVAHELGNPLNSLTIHLQLIKRQLEKKDAEFDLKTTDSSLSVCTREVGRLDGIIRNFLGAVRPTQPNFQDVDLISVMGDVLETIGQELKDQGVSVDIDIDRKPPLVVADPNQIEQVYFNLLRNASEAMEGGGTIRVRSRSDDEFVYLQIGDSGSGIEGQNLSKVFEPYYTTKKGGHGLGMMIVHRIMSEHGGLVGIDSRMGTGTVVTLQLPRRHRRIRRLKS
ncbi:MAG: Sporulation kinase E [Candidatus Moanabacter tarae]|uniref:histidine kinase n=1 Tax=Candidatus Moanibacter tarae TaxID=2200854 RepID=A0A2Z4ABL1_9BACT|nr:MAG: Sporulation kinase E [Candidatus Moanabacter tarae]|tara:strand:+ start:27905 stop:29086 length:1182 start_codon:yes stop_codon:yes gene_type:complete